MKYTLSLVIAITLFFLLYATTNAQTPLFTDDFSNGFDKWQDVRGTMQFWSIVNEAAYVAIPQRSTLAELVPKTEYWNPAWQDIVVIFDYTYHKGADRNISFWFQDTLNWYEVHFVAGQLHLSHIQNGWVVWQHSQSYELWGGYPRKVELHLNAGHIVMIIDGEEVINQVDPTFNNSYGSIALKAGAGSAFPTQITYDTVAVYDYHEYHTASEEDQKNQTITPLMQTDSRWKNIEYDSASIWSPTKSSIADWGCLLTSLIMVLEHHNITKMPNGDMLTPITLNEWLIAQPDGYLGSGLISIPSVMRLVRAISEAHQTTKLEYARVLGPDIEPAVSVLNSQQPVILEIPGHFVVGHDLIKSPENSEIPSVDIAIHDPFFSHTTLSQHQKPLRSTRTFTPSMTDLSYIVLSHSPALSVLLTDSAGLAPIGYTVAQYAGTSADGAISAAPLVVHEIAQPATGLYSILIESAQPLENHELTLFAYDQTGEVIVLSQPTIITMTEAEGVYSTRLTLDYSGSNSKLIYQESEQALPPITPEYLLATIARLHTEQKIYKHFVAHELTTLTQLLLEWPQHHEKITSALSWLLNWYEPYLETQARQELQQLIIKLQELLETKPPDS